MPKLQQVEPSRFDEVHAELLTLLDPDRPVEEWRRIFDYGWQRSEEYAGYVIVDDGELVGFIGMIFSELPVDGKSRRFCNVSSWIAKETHRPEATALILPLRDLKDYTITNLSCNDIAYRIFTRLGFKVLETHTAIFSPLRSREMADSTRCDVSFAVDEIGCVLTGLDARIFEDHLVYAHHLVVRDDEGYCYLLYTLGRRRRLRTARVHHISDKQRFSSNLAAIQRSLLRRHGAVLTECDARLVEGIEIRSSHKKRLEIPRLFTSPDLGQDQISNLYSEVVLLNIA